MPDAPSPLRVAVDGRCPRCGATGLFRNWIGFRERCASCGLDFAAFNVGDGPTPFIILIVGAFVVGMALWLELAVEPPFWVHLVAWLPLVLVASLGALRFAKGLLLALEYRHKAVEGRLDDPE